MRLPATTSTFLEPRNDVTWVMLNVNLALLPTIAALLLYFGWGVLINVTLAIASALACEAGMLALRRRPIRPFLSDLSAVVTALLLAIAIPPPSPWWLTVIGVAFAIIVAKHLYGGLGHNPFNPAMAGYALLLISFPAEMARWIPPHMLTETTLGLLDSLRYTFFGHLPEGVSLDALTMATPLDTMRTQLALDETIGEIRTDPVFGDFGGKGWEWVNNWVFLGGVWLLYRRVISWHTPVGMLGGLLAISLLFYVFDPDSHPFPLFHIFSGGAMLGAFFVATDPVSGCTSNRGKLFFGLGTGALTFIIRTWGGYPDGIAFAVLLMNMAAPTIDHYTRPQVVGHERR
jgi:electron transport complex protein RnfD